MNTPPLCPRARPKDQRDRRELAPERRAAFSLIETAIAMAILGGLLVASLSVVGAIARMRRSVNEQQMARLLAEDLMAEALAAAYEDPAGGGSLGPDAGETSSNRGTFDDVDDYQGWSATPKTRDGAALVPDATWALRVQVAWVQPGSPETVSGSETGVKRITVQAARNSRVLASLTALRTAAWEDAR